MTHCQLVTSNGIGRDWPIMFGLVGTLESIFYRCPMFVWCWVIFWDKVLVMVAHVGFVPPEGFADGCVLGS